MYRFEKKKNTLPNVKNIRDVDKIAAPLRPMNQPNWTQQIKLIKGKKIIKKDILSYFRFT